MRKPTPRQLAAQSGESHYFSGKPCSNGHTTERLVSNGQCLACHRERTAKKRASNRDEYNASMRDYRAANKEKIQQINAKAAAKYSFSGKRSTNSAKRRDQDPAFRLKSNYYRRLNHALNGAGRSDNATELLGCSIEEFRAHIERQWEQGMSWDNYSLSGWHIDHIRPCASFDLLDHEQLRECFHYTNLQPLWAEDNLTKGAKL